MNDTVTESDTGIERQATDLVFEYELDAPPEKVWRAISIPAFRDRWLPNGELAQAEPVASKPGEEIAYAMRDHAPPFLESVVTFQVTPNAVGGARLRIIHGLVDARLERCRPRAANSNCAGLMLAA
ncbi:polyketide cyclase [Caulobacter sp. Root656]|nr:polyketide cyclase [Caulobacter sp. Root656]